MKKLITIPGVTALLLAFVIAGCGKTTPTTGGTPPAGNTVEMASTNFVQSTITVKTGDAVKFTNPTSTGGLHILCFGHNEVCASNPNGPAELNTSGGVMFNQGDTKSFTFATAGTYEVTCTVHPNMNVMITVQ